MKGLIYDTSVYIQSWRNPQTASTAIRNGNPTTIVDEQPIYLSSVVLEELYVGGLDKKTKKALAAIEKRFQNLNRLLTPNHSDWIATGKILSQIGKKYGFELVKLSRMTNDCLIAVSAQRVGLSVVTLNDSDFQKIAEFRIIDFTVL